LKNIAGQNYIGLYKDEIRKNIPSQYQGFVFEKEVLNGNKSFIKFVNANEEQTLLFVLHEKGYCTSSSRMYNTWLYNQVENELKKKYAQIDSTTWVESANNHKYEIRLIKGEWFITVTTYPYSNEK